MRKLGVFYALPFLALALFGLPQVRASEQANLGKKTEAEPEKGTQASLEERIKELEKKVQELEASPWQSAPRRPRRSRRSCRSIERPRQFGGNIMDESLEPLPPRTGIRIQNGTAERRPAA